MGELRGEAGSATVFGSVLIAALLTVAIGGCAVGAAVVARHRAQSGADLAALAAAVALPLGADAACARAAAVGRGTSITLRDCAVDHLDVVVTSGVAVRIGRWDLGEARASARAGPVD